VENESPSLTGFLHFGLRKRIMGGGKMEPSQHATAIPETLAVSTQSAISDEGRTMDQDEILAFITQVETEDIDPVHVVKVYAAAVNEMQTRISSQDLRRLLLIGAAMYRNSMKGQHVELQLPTQESNGDWTEMLENEPFRGILH
jgi:hypothetical protein